MSAINRMDVLYVLSDFDRSGGGSRELVAWELLVTPGALEPVWTAMLADGLIQSAAADEYTGELMVRLTAQGWDALRRIDFRDPAVGEVVQRR
jgi:DNA-binding PadR family transcriptional regulator